MPKDKKKLIQILVLVILIVVLLAALFAAGILRWPKPPKPPYDTGGPNITSARDAYDAAEQVAKGWHADAVLSTINSNRTQNPGDEIDKWQFIFVSPGMPGRGFLVSVSTAKVEGFEEISFSGTAAPFPENIISQGEAINRIRQIRGYENEPILGIEAVYDPVRHAWFWAARTARGVVSIDASK